MFTRVAVLLVLLALAGCADDPQSCRQAGGSWDGVSCSRR